MGKKGEDAEGPGTQRCLWMNTSSPEDLYTIVLRLRAGRGHRAVCYGARSWLITAQAFMCWVLEVRPGLLEHSDSTNELS